MDGIRFRHSDCNSRAVRAFDVAPFFCLDGRRLQDRAGHHWASMLGGRALPLVGDLDLETADYASAAVMLDLRTDGDGPSIGFLGEALRVASGLADRPRDVARPPVGSLLAYMIDRARHVVTNRTPIRVAGEVVDNFGATIAYRVLWLPFSQDGDRVDHLLGVAHWTERVGADTAAALQQSVEQALRYAGPPIAPTALWA